MKYVFYSVLLRNSILRLILHSN